MDETESELDIPKYIISFYSRKFRAVLGNSQHPLMMKWWQPYLPALLAANPGLQLLYVLPKAQHRLCPFLIL
ncbi:hypothetical protein XELAEV_18026016mg [Xenopus laevis]|uniref:Uncharacterized protein n=1 Tax=Xenopus laevis TaxID=8355 RepID=A0A974D1P7_XENLA|nr:hypothetical protein XELAEV_18026016mg [Xenopus laevis]